MSCDPFERLDDRQRHLLEAFEQLLLDFNRRINLVSRQDEQHVFVHHIVHCLYLTYRRFPEGCTIVDWGTGGGLPAIPLAIAVPDVEIIAVDAVDKKVRAVRAMARRLGLDNVDARRGRAEAFTAEAAYSVSRAAARLPDLWAWHRRVAQPTRVNGRGGFWRPGLLCLKGGDIQGEIAEVADSATVEQIALSGLDARPYFHDKLLLACTPKAGSAERPDSEPDSGI